MSDSYFLKQQHFHACEQIRTWIKQDAWRLSLLDAAEKMQLPQWCIAAGFVRNLIWDKLHGYKKATPLTDIDLIYFDPEYLDEGFEKEIEAKLTQLIPVPWSVKNQARMHLRNDDKPYTSTFNAMAYWVELETAVGAYLAADQTIKIISPFTLNIDRPRATLNPDRPKPVEFLKRLENKNWTKIWPALNIIR